MEGLHPQVPGIGDLPGEGGGHGGLRGHQIHLGIRRTAAALEVAVEGPQAHTAGVGGEAHTDTGAAGTFQQPRTGDQNIRQRAAVGQHGQDLPGAGGHGHTDRGGHGPAFQHGGGFQQIVQRGIGAGADADLIHLNALQTADGHHLIRHVRAGDQRLQRVQINVDNPVIGRIGISGKGCEVGFPPLCLQKGAGHFIGGEDGGGSPQLCTHIGDGGPLRNGQSSDAGTTPFHHMTHAALDGEKPQDLQADVLGGDEGTQRTGQFDLDDLGHGNVVGSAAHSHGYVHAPRAEGQHPDAAAGGGVTVGADEGLPRYAEAFQMHLMADAVAGAGEPDAVLGGNGLDVPVIVGVFKAGLEGVVVDIGHGPLCFDPVNAHRLKFQIGHGAGGILRQGLVNAQGHLSPRLHAAADQMSGDQLFCQCLSHGSALLLDDVCQIGPGVFHMAQGRLRSPVPIVGGKGLVDGGVLL